MLVIFIWVSLFFEVHFSCLFWYCGGWMLSWMNHLLWLFPTLGGGWVYTSSFQALYQTHPQMSFKFPLASCLELCQGFVWNSFFRKKKISEASIFCSKLQLLLLIIVLLAGTVRRIKNKSNIKIIYNLFLSIIIGFKTSYLFKFIKIFFILTNQGQNQNIILSKNFSSIKLLVRQLLWNLDQYFEFSK